jgi:hypothetical protein
VASKKQKTQKQNNIKQKHLHTIQSGKLQIHTPTDMTPRQGAGGAKQRHETCAKQCTASACSEPGLRSVTRPTGLIGRLDQTDRVFNRLSTIFIRVYTHKG